MKTASVFTILASLLFAAGCATPGVHEADRGLEGTLRSEINERHVHVDVHHGIVTLEGHVRTAADRDRIEALVRNTSGVVAVKDELRVTFPSPGVYGAYPTTTIPVYPGELPAPTPPVAVLTPPPARVIPEYPKVRVQATTDADQIEADRIVAQLRAAALPLAAEDTVTITVRNGNVSLGGVVQTPEEHGALIEALQHTGGIKAIYDALTVG